MENQRKPELWGYIREWKTGPARLDQMEALKTMGLTDFGDYGPVYQDKQPKPNAVGPDRFPARDSLLKAVQSGDDIVIAAPCVIGATAADIVLFMQKMSAKGVRLYVVSKDQWYQWTPAAVAAAAFAREAEAEVNQLRMAKARFSRKTAGGRPRIDFDAALLAEIEAMWRTKGVDEQVVIKKAGRSRSWLNRQFGGRGTGKVLCRTET
jgi:hypothetical protein